MHGGGSVWLLVTVAVSRRQRPLLAYDRTTGPPTGHPTAIDRFRSSGPTGDASKRPLTSLPPIAGVGVDTEINAELPAARSALTK
jgi:hypothetical protein